MINIPKEYILQCLKAVEIQLLIPSPSDNCYNLPVGCYFYNKKTMESFCVGDVNESRGICDCCEDWDITLEECIWLPRQDQLQEMIQDRFQRPQDLCVVALELFRATAVGYCSSMEQLWLAFVMKEKYNKIWKEKDWVKQ